VKICNQLVKKGKN